MNFWQFLTNIGNSLWSHGTRVLGVAQGTIALLAGMDGIIPANHLKYYLAASAILTFWRGQANADTIADKVIAKQGNSDEQATADPPRTDTH